LFDPFPDLLNKAFPQKSIIKLDYLAHNPPTKEVGVLR